MNLLGKRMRFTPWTRVPAVPVPLINFKQIMSLSKWNFIDFMSITQDQGWWIFFVIHRAAMFGKGTGVHQYTWQPGRYPAMSFHGDDWNVGHNRSQKMINIKALHGSILASGPNFNWPPLVSMSRIVSDPLMEVYICKHQHRHDTFRYPAPNPILKQPHLS